MERVDMAVDTVVDMAVDTEVDTVKAAMAVGIRVDIIKVIFRCFVHQEMDMIYYVVQPTLVRTAKAGLCAWI